jgi:3-oxoadipate enol-lactonase
MLSKSGQSPDDIQSGWLASHERYRHGRCFSARVGGGARIWALQEQSFRRAGFQPVALDLPGYGARPPVDVLDIAGIAEDVEITVDRLGLEQPVVIGHSLGGLIAQTMLRRRPDAYRAVVLAATSPAFGDPAGDFQRKFVADRLAPLEAGKSLREIAPAAFDGMVGRAADPLARALFIDVMAAVPVSTYRASVRCLAGFDERANLAHIRVPVLCLAAEHDRAAPAAMMARMAGKIPGARYVCLPGLGHLLNLEDPAAFDGAVLDFLREVLASKASV